MSPVSALNKYLNSKFEHYIPEGEKLEKIVHCAYNHGSFCMIFGNNKVLYARNWGSNSGLAFVVLNNRHIIYISEISLMNKELNKHEKMKIKNAGISEDECYDIIEDAMQFIQEAYDNRHLKSHYGHNFDFDKNDKNIILDFRPE